MLIIKIIMAIKIMAIKIILVIIKIAMKLWSWGSLRIQRPLGEYRSSRIS